MKVLYILPCLLFSVSAFSQRPYPVKPPLGLAFGMSQDKVSEIMKSQGVAIKQSELSYRREFNHVAIGKYSARVTAEFDKNKLYYVQVFLLNTPKARREFEDIRSGLIEKHSIPDIRAAFDEQNFTASETWLFSNGIIKETLAEQGIMMYYIDKVLAEKLKNESRKDFK